MNVIRTLYDETHCGLVEHVTSALWARGNVELAGKLAADPGAQAAAVEAVVDQGRWIAHCPGCPGAALVDVDDLRFFCLSCLNESTGGRWLMVALPVQRPEIDALLAARPVEWRRWNPLFSLDDLATENLLHPGW